MSRLKIPTTTINKLGYNYECCYTSRSFKNLGGYLRVFTYNKLRIVVCELPMKDSSSFIQEITYPYNVCIKDENNKVKIIYLFKKHQVLNILKIIANKFG